MAARLPGMIAAAMVGGVAILYIVVIRSQGAVHDTSVVAGFSSALFAAVVTALAGSLAGDSYGRRLAFGIAAAIAFVCMWISGLSIGPLLLPAVVLLTFACARG